MTTPPGATIRRSSRQYNKTIYRDDYQVKTAGLAKGTRRKHSSTVSDGDDVVITGESQKTNISNDKDEEVSPTKGQQGTFQTARQILMSTTMNNNKNRNEKRRRPEPQCYLMTSLSILPVQHCLLHFHGKFEINKLQLCQLRKRMYQMLMRLLDAKFTPYSKNKHPAY